MKKRCCISLLSTSLFFNLLFVLLTAVLVTTIAGGTWAAVGEVKFDQKISDTEGNFTGVLHNVNHFGIAATSIGDLDGDGVGDIAVGANRDNDGGASRGAVWILFLNADGTVKQQQKISALEGNFTGTLDNEDRFGINVAGLGDHDGDGIEDLAVGAILDDDGGTNWGAVWILFLNSDGTVKQQQKISALDGNFTGFLGSRTQFSEGLCSLGDLDGDGVGDLGVGADQDDDGGNNRGAVWILFLNSDGTVKAHQKISDTEGGFTGTLDDMDQFGGAVDKIDDLDGDGVQDLVVSAWLDDWPTPTRGAVWILFLNSDGTVKAHQKISDTEGGFTGELDNNDVFGIGVASLGDLDCDGREDIAVGAGNDDDGGTDRGAVWVLFLNNDGTVKAHQKISALEGNFSGPPTYRSLFGYSVTGLDDLDGDGVGEIVVTAPWDADGGYRRGAAWVLFLEGTVCVELDIKPGSCPNPLNIKIFEMDPPKNAKSKKGGVLPVALLGEDVSQIDVSSLSLEGVAPLRHDYEDVTAAAQGSDACDCTTAGPDGATDLTLKFLKREVAAAIGGAFDGEVITLTMTGELLDGTPFEASDCVVIRSKEAQPPTFNDNSAVMLFPAVPNPFNPVTRISYALGKRDFVTLAVYDVRGRLVETLVAEIKPTGEYVATWDATGLTNGIYFYRMKTSDYSETRKLVLLK